ncbi:MAG: AAA family ATPase [Blautia sp.]|nr:AAA family ATPase [Blautia sp.]
MGVYLNPGNQKYVSVSRPRRFGKSMAVNMLCAYYGREADSRSLFANKKKGAFLQRKNI